MHDFYAEESARQAKQDRLYPLVHARALRLTEDDLDGTLGDMVASDSLGRGRALLNLPEGSYDYGDIYFIFQVLKSVYTEKTQRQWQAKLESSWEYGPIFELKTALNYPLRLPSGLHIPAMTTGTWQVVRQPRIRVPLLDLFGLLCGSKTREEVVELAVADIRRLARTQRRKGRNERFVRFLVWWHVLRCMLAVVSDGLARAASKFTSILRVFG